MLKTPIFWLMILLMVWSGASEATMAQWASAFTESAMVGGLSEMAGGNLKTGLFVVAIFLLILVVGLLMLRKLVRNAGNRELIIDK